MTRQTTDGLFIDLGYFTPENYLVYTAEAEAEVAAESSMVCDAGKITQGAAAITDAFVATVAVEAVINSFAVLDSNFDFASTVNRTVDPGGLLEFFADLNSAAAKIVDPELAFDAVFTVNGNSGIGNIGTNVTYDDAANLTVVAAISCDVIKITPGSIAITDSFATTFTVSAIRNSFAVFESLTNLESTVNRTVDPGSVLQLVAELNSAAEKVVDVEIAFDSVFNVNGNSGIGDIGTTVTYDDAANLNVVAALNCDVGKITQGAAAITDAFVATVAISAIINSFAVLNSNFNFASTANKTVDADAALQLVAELNSAVEKIVDFEIAVDAAFTVNGNSGIGDIGTNVIYNDAANLNVVAALNCDGNAIPIVSASAAISAAATLTAEGIEYIRKSNLPASTSGRPWDIKFISSNSTAGSAENPTFDSSTKKFGSHSIRFYKDDTNPQNTNSYITYYAGDATGTFPTTASGESYQIDLWVNGKGQFVRAVGNQGQGDQFRISGDGTSPTIRLDYLIGNSNYIRLSGSYTDGEWTFVTVKAEGGVVKLYINGSLAGTSSTNYSRTSVNELVFGDDNTVGGIAQDRFFYVDEVRIFKGSAAAVSSDLGYNFSASSITVPTTESKTRQSTQLLLHFNNSYVDDLYGDQFAAAGISSAATITAIAGSQLSAVATLSTSIAISIAAAKLQETSADFDTIATQLTAAAKVGDFFVNADIIANLAIDPDIFKESSADLVAVANSITVAVKTTSTNSALTVTASMQTDNEGLIVGAANLNSEFALTATTGKITEGAAVLTANSELSTVAIKAVEAEGAAAAETQITVLSMRIRDNTADFEAVATQLTAAAKTGVSVIAADVIAELSATAVVRRGNIIDLNCSTVASTEANKTAQGSVAIAANSLLTIDGVVGVVGEGTLISEASILIQARADYSGNAAIQDAFSATVIAVANLTNEIDLGVQSNLVVQAQVTRTTAVTISSTTVVALAAGRRLSAVANLPVISTALTVGREIHINQYVYIIPRESTAFTIRKETRDYLITG